MYQLARADNEDTIIYYDRDGNKYVATGGTLAWRINNPGLVRSPSHFANQKTIKTLVKKHQVHE